jgi:hypothetical protein
MYVNSMLLWALKFSVSKNANEVNETVSLPFF